MDGKRGLAAILRDARKGALLRMRSEIYSQPRMPGPSHRPLLASEGIGHNTRTRLHGVWVPASEPVKNTDLILRSLRSKRLEGWTQRMDSRPSFETRPKAASQDEVIVCGAGLRATLLLSARALPDPSSKKPTMEESDVVAHALE